MDKINILIDADSIYFKAACVTKKKADLRKIINRKMKEIIGDCMFFDENPNIMVAVKGNGNYRDDLYPDYKGQRPELDEDMKKALKYGHEYMKEKWDAVQCNGFEADDLVATWAWEALRAEQTYVVVHIDKDLDQIPGIHYNFNKGELYELSDEEAYKKLMLQCLTGDRVDNIPGIKGIGPKKAEGILNGLHPVDYWKTIRDHWGSDECYLSHSLLRMFTSLQEYRHVVSRIQG